MKYMWYTIVDADEKPVAGIFRSCKQAVAARDELEMAMSEGGELFVVEYVGQTPEV